MKINNVALYFLLFFTVFCSSTIAAENSATYSDTSASKIKINLVLAEQSGEYHSPYVAAWLENDKNQAVRNLVLWRTKAKWLKDIRRWWRKIGRKDQQLVDGITSATRGVGSYPLTFKALDDNGNILPQGNYTLFIEVVREKGGRAIVKQAITLSNSPVHHTIKATPETGEIHITFTP